MTEAIAPEKTGTEVSLAIEDVQTAVARFDAIAAGLAALEREHPKDVILDVTTSVGMELAVESRRAWREPRIALEKARKAGKKPILDLGRKIDAFAGDLEDKLREGEDHYDSQIKAEEGRKEAIRQEKLQAEAERVAAIRRRIAQAFTIEPNPTGIRYTSAQLEEIRNRLAGRVVEDVGDLSLEAEETRAQTLRVLDDQIFDQKVREAEAAKLEEDRAALAEERRRDAAAAEERRAAEARQRADEEAERARVRAAEDEARRVADEEIARRRAEIEAREADQARRDAEAASAERERLEAANRAREFDETAQREANRISLEAGAERSAKLFQAAGAMLELLRDWKALDDENGSGPTVEHYLGLMRQRRDVFVFNLRDVQP